MIQQEVPTLASYAKAKPIVKWAGGKSGLIPQYQKYFPPQGSYRRYFEPFVGGGAVFFHLQPPQSYLFDLNEDLIDLYRIVRDDVESVIIALRRHYNDRDYYYQIRDQDPTNLTPQEKAARFLFLNKTCYNGLYRVNRSGRFNVPFGYYVRPVICDGEGLRAASQALNNAILWAADYGAVLQFAETGDLIYFDPPYVPLNPTSNFTSYTGAGFTEADQRQLAETYHLLNERGCLLMLSNSTAPLVYELYEDFGYHMHTISARRAINSKADRRQPISELLISNFDPRDL